MSLKTWREKCINASEPSIVLSRMSGRNGNGRNGNATRCWIATRRRCGNCWLAKRVIKKNVTNVKPDV